MSRYKAALIHLFISASVFALFLVLVLSVWYVYPYHRTEGVISIIFIMTAVDVVLGPLLTLLLFKSGKKGLKLDISLIAALQIIALLYGAHTIYSERPVYIVFAHNQFDVVVNSEIDTNTIPENIKKVSIFDKPVLVFQPRSIDPKLDEYIFGITAVEGGPNRLSANAVHYKNYLENKITILENTEQVLESDILSSEGVDTNLHYAIVKGKVKQTIVLLNPKDASVSGFVHRSKLLDF